MKISCPLSKVRTTSMYTYSGLSLPCPCPPFSPSLPWSMHATPFHFMFRFCCTTSYPILIRSDVLQDRSYGIIEKTQGAKRKPCLRKTRCFLAWTQAKAALHFQEFASLAELCSSAAIFASRFIPPRAGIVVRRLYRNPFFMLHFDFHDTLSFWQV